MWRWATSVRSSRLEASRLARSNQDWHRLLELCAITGTLVIDEDGVYCPAEFNDGLVLGMKGTFAQAELHIIRARLHGGKLNKASRGDLRFPLPVGLVYDEDKIVLDPDREVQGAVRYSLRVVRTRGHCLQCCKTVPGAWPAVPTPCLWRCVERQAAVGSSDPLSRPRPPGQSFLRRCLRVRSLPILEAGGALR